MFAIHFSNEEIVRRPGLVQAGVAARKLDAAFIASLETPSQPFAGPAFKSEGQYFA
jgi:hypothetical protein